MASWNSVPLEISYQILGWIAFFSWSFSFYPQVILNFRRKSVVGLNFDYLVLNFTKHSSYLVYNASMFFSPVIQKQYREKYGLGQVNMNFMRKSTKGWSIGNVSLDLLGGVTNCAQMVMQSIDQGSWVNFYGNAGKTMLSLVSILFDLLFMLQHYVLYPYKKEETYSEVDDENAAPLIKSSDHAQSENV